MTPEPALPTRRRLPLVPPADPASSPQGSLRAGLRRFVARRAPAEHVDDIVQEIFLRMSEHAAELRDEERVLGWAYRIAQNVVVDHHRRRRAQRARLEPTADPPELPAERDEDENVNETVAGWLRPMLGLLPAEYAEALERVDLEGMSQKDYAARAGLSVSGAKSRVQRARKMLEGAVRACCDLEQDARGNVLSFTRRAPRGPRG